MLIKPIRMTTKFHVHAPNKQASRIGLSMKGFAYDNWLQKYTSTMAYIHEI